MQFWQELLKDLGGFAVISAVLAWLIKGIVSQYLNKDIEKYKSQLSYENSKQIESLKTKLQITAKEHDIRFSKLHEKRAEILSELYLAVYQTKEDSNYLQLALIPKDGNLNVNAIEQRAKVLLLSSENTLNYFRKYKLYLSSELSDLIEKFLSRIQMRARFLIRDEGEQLAQMVDNQLKTKKRTPNDILLDKYDPANWREVGRNFPDILSKIEKEFRLILGSDENSVKK